MSEWSNAPREPLPVRPRGRALLRGLRRRCPACGEGRMFRAFLKVADRCAHCGEELHHHEADDAPAYFVIFIVGHIVVPLLLLVEIRFAPPLAVHFAIWPTLTLVLALVLIAPIKGAVIAMQWAFGMHAFDPAPESGVSQTTSRDITPS
jgi:uncharacterized protein (DUF983 family)